MVMSGGNESSQPLPFFFFLRILRCHVDGELVQRTKNNMAVELQWFGVWIWRKR